MACGLIKFEEVTAICIYLVEDGCEWIIRKPQPSDLNMLSNNQMLRPIIKLAFIHRVITVFSEKNRGCDFFCVAEDSLREGELFCRNAHVFGISSI